MIINNHDSLNLVLIGHIDHGKSTLIGRLLFDTKSISPEKIEEIKNNSKNMGNDIEFAYLLDHLEEERQQGITIDITQVFFHTEKRHYNIIDAPGHVEFVKNMITGSSQADVAILIIDAERGLEKQTKRHSYILSLLGINQVVVAINKMDLVDYDKKVFVRIESESKKWLDNICINSEYFIPISAMQGENVVKKSNKMKWYSGLTILESLDEFKPKTTFENRQLILPVQDIYKIDNKRIIVGKIEEGTIEENQDIYIYPEKFKTKIKTIEKYQENIKIAVAGHSIGVTLNDAFFYDRGFIIGESSKQFQAADYFNANIFWMDNSSSLNKECKYILRLATQEIVCQIININKRIDSATLEIIEENSNVLKYLEVAEVEIKSKKPIIVKPFSESMCLGRFVLIHDDNVVAGGIVV